MSKNLETVIRIQLVRGCGLSSYLIAREGFPVLGYSHVMLLLDDGTVIDSRDDKIICMDGVPRAGVHHRPNWYQDWKFTTTIEFQVTPEAKKRAIEWAHKKCGSKYDQAAILGFILGLKRHDKGRFICSAFLDDVLVMADVLKPMHIPASQISPDMLYVRALDCGGKIVSQTAATHGYPYQVGRPVTPWTGGALEVSATLS